MTNAGEDAAVILNRVREGKGTFGYNAASGEFGDMIEMGILDPTEVTRLALQIAASVAGLCCWLENSTESKSASEVSRHAASPPRRLAASPSEPRHQTHGVAMCS